MVSRLLASMHDFSPCAAGYPIVGPHAFAHEAGIHPCAIPRAAVYDILRPEKSSVPMYDAETLVRCEVPHVTVSGLMNVVRYSRDPDEISVAAGRVLHMVRTDQTAASPQDDSHPQNPEFVAPPVAPHDLIAIILRCLGTPVAEEAKNMLLATGEKKSPELILALALMFPDCQECWRLFTMLLQEAKGREKRYLLQHARFAVQGVFRFKKGQCFQLLPSSFPASLAQARKIIDAIDVWEREQKGRV